ncbi:Uncharacterized protein TCM_020675 [Theobroma cacao]|uniref:Uncharacterized protein n=1 Tax=Theobroma cacao TaxID=3641 RepID=A0A061EL71_THECC|nr:Uncharacterized protein TCM_020675 [Theobroma cacao]
MYLVDKYQEGTQRDFQTRRFDQQNFDIGLTTQTSSSNPSCLMCVANGDIVHLDATELSQRGFTDQP